MSRALAPQWSIGNLETSLNRLFDEFFDNSLWLISNSWNGPNVIGELGKSAYPRVNIKDLPEKIVVEASVPGMTKDNINVEWKDDILTISGQSRNEKTSNNKYFKKEIHQSAFTRSFSVNKNEYNVEQIDCKLENGLMVIDIPKNTVKLEEVKKIEIK